MWATRIDRRETNRGTETAEVYVAEDYDPHNPPPASDEFEERLEKAMEKVAEIAAEDEATRDEDSPN